MYLRTNIRLAASVCAILCCAATSHAQFTLEWHTVDAGGEMANIGGPFSLGAAIGQPDAGPFSAPLVGGNFSLVGGFWVEFGTPCTGDLTGDKQVNQADLGVLLAAYNTCPGDPGYHSGAGHLAPEDPCVTQADLGVLLANYGSVCP